MPPNEPWLWCTPLQVQVAIDAVQSTDVLNQEIDYVAEGERLRQRKLQQQQLQQPVGRSGRASGGVPVPGPPPQTPNAGPAAAPRPPPKAPLTAAPFGESGVSISSSLGRQPPGALSREVRSWTLQGQILP